MRCSACLFSLRAPRTNQLPELLNAAAPPPIWSLTWAERKNRNGSGVKCVSAFLTDYFRFAANTHKYIHAPSLLSTLACARSHVATPPLTDLPGYKKGNSCTCIYMCVCVCVCLYIYIGV